MARRRSRAIGSAGALRRRAGRRCLARCARLAGASLGGGLAGRVARRARRWPPPAQPRRPIRRAESGACRRSPFGSFEELIALAAQNRDIGVKAALERDVRLVRCEDGRLEIALEPSAPRTLVHDLVAQVLAVDQPALDGDRLGRAGEPT